MKKLLLLCLAALLSLSLFAQEEEEVYCFAVSYASANEVDYFAVDANPVVSFGEGTLSVTQDGEDAYSIEEMSLTDVEKWYFCDAVPGVGEKPAEETGIRSASAASGSFHFSSGQALMTGLTAGATVYVYTADGQTVHAVSATAEGTAVVDLTSLPHGQVYILRTPCASYKIVK